MRFTLAFLLSFLSAQFLYAQDYIDGYYVLSGKDTVAAKIKIGGKKISTNYYALVVKGEDETPVVFKAKDKKIGAYGYQVGWNRFDYRFIEIEKTNDGGFFRQIVYGPHYQLYLHMVSTNVNGVVTTLPHYGLYKSNGEFVYLTVHLLGNWKRNLRKILADNPTALSEVEELNKNDIPEFITRLNNQ
ncbi:hypothetical protein GYM62_11935 [Algoriphagus sp. NBT04N3]|jgi:hypothetical protein|uniref:hypothetical protein n=1 Tax=Algoriphagus sp. NBT04N3 TaxID=2705473 RepID=UPI001C636200|nr:hypothetical protein [Algoriphagus sp. NBT04N3]QYH39458.1 hypothetical protein GYM62_11935 [Algoriphagus sp. NBT04N3]